VALLLATVGIYVVTAYSVAQRTHEIGIRMALGARRGQVLIFVMRQGMRLSALGVAIGLLIALAIGRVLAFFLRGITVGQLSTYLRLCGRQHNLKYVGISFGDSIGKYISWD